MKPTITCRADEAWQVFKSDTDEADTIRPGTDEAKAAHIFITGHRQAEGIRLSIAGATAYRSTLLLHHYTTTVYMEKTR